MSENERFWREHLAAAEVSGLSTKAYAELHELAVQELYKWRNRIQRQARRQSSSGFMQVNLERQPQVAELTNPGVVSCAVIFEGIRIELTGLPPAAWLRSLSQANQGVQ